MAGVCVRVGRGNWRLMAAAAAQYMGGSDGDDMNSKSLFLLLLL